MEALKRECWFHREQATPHSTKIDTAVLDGYVARGRVALAAVKLSDGRDVSSVTFKGASQGDVNGLPCGARSLLIDRADGSIVCRGINKFFDLNEVGDDWLSDSSLWTDAYCMWAVRKMAGFIVTLFSLDGVRLEVMSKHVLVGPHVDAARELLERVSETRRARLAADLFEWGACACCECIRRAQDYHHPVLELQQFDQQIVLIAVQRRTQLREESLCFSEVTTLAERWGLGCAPGVAVPNSDALRCVFAATASWNATYTPFDMCPQLAEGFVLLIEMAGPTAAPGQRWCLPLRLKLKTAKYVVLRAFRSLVYGDSRPQSYVYHQALLGWLQLRSAAEVRRRVEEVGVHALNNDFESGLSAQQRVRHRDSQETVGDALARLQRTTALIACPRGRCPLTVVVLCGLPGAGKSTLAMVLSRLLASQEASPFSFVVHLSRDAVGCTVAADHGITDASSKHKQRRLGALVHQTLCDQMREVACFSAETEQSGLLLLDACNATQKSRRIWRQCFPITLHKYEVAYVECSDASAMVQRAARRDGHEVLLSAAEAQQALYAVRKKFQPPSVEEAAWRVDTTGCCVEEAAASLCTHLAERAPPSSCAGCCRILTISALRDERREGHATLLHNLLGISETTTEALASMVLSVNSGPKVARATSLQLRLDCSTEALRCAAAQLISSSLDEPREPALSFASVGRLLFRGVSAALRGFSWAPSFPVTGHVTRGHLKWLRGWLLRGRDPSGPAELEKALRERFAVVPARPHVTLLYINSVAGATSANQAMSEYLSQAGMHLGQEVTVKVTSLLLDRHALSFGVTLTGGQQVQGQSMHGTRGTATRLHITVGTAPGVAASYAGNMFAIFDVLQAENESLETERRESFRAVNRSQRKYHNFVEYQLSTALPVRGVVEVCGS
ncbi:RNA ligase/6-phosphofructo-2-kinase/NACHT domain/AAA domain containing protein [Leishmania donovani]|uniref:RNA_ligase/6-phosphofructo-2-kinase/NACHT_domain/ AAA_domain_containing_protein_putative/Pfam:PF09511/Pfam:PF 01591/Pfam:PF05729/Pfam:PF13671 n=1 Tax=Leishmania donovani TaxID=5661 RepID=A0A6J8FQ94_LEIDO|nr:RNA ligase/6-phosphofructo-2-kinase/NACHT domain/AAA domain containing protein [Leishmania donovani]VDZ49922.1 RNA_ligase/6-phosphofructo-2-kinase/NACHT_domain/AAA_domain_containing_protein_putative/Pfam:PF09511/Pfam:PF01591/Pfam:PF05729/Pfam:PF13671 [Leishmania donovani]